MTKQEQEIERKQIIKMFKNGIERKKIYEVSEMSKSTVDHTIAEYKKNGNVIVQMKKRGRKTGEVRLLTPEQEKNIRRALIDKDPNQYKLPSFVWDRRTVSALINQIYGIKLPLSTMGYYFKRWGFTAQRPNLTNYKQNPKEVQIWLKEEYPTIKEQAKNEDAEILWGDETAIQNECNYVKSYAPIGETPTLKTKGQHTKINMISAVSNKGKVRFMFYSENMTQQKLIKFMENLIRNAKKKIIFIIDNLKVHHGKKVKAWLEKHKEKIEVRYLPKYSPDYNPDEYLNGNLKRNMAKSPKTESAKVLHDTAKDFMLDFQKNPQHCIKWFRHHKIAYAA